MADQSGDYKIRALADSTGPDGSTDCWVAVQHVPCAEFIFGDGADDPDDLMAEQMNVLIQNHVCKTDNLRYEDVFRRGEGP